MIKIKYRKISIINVQAQTEKTNSQFCEKMEHVYRKMPNNDVKMVLGDCLISLMFTNVFLFGTKFILNPMLCEPLLVLVKFSIKPSTK